MLTKTNGAHLILTSSAKPVKTETEFCCSLGHAENTFPMLRFTSRKFCVAAAPGRSVLAALIERVPVVTPILPEWKLKVFEFQDKITQQAAKVYPKVFTDAEEGPDRKQARLRADVIIQAEGSREGEGDKMGDETSMARKLVRLRPPCCATLPP